MLFCTCRKIFPFNMTLGLFVEKEIVGITCWKVVHRDKFSDVYRFHKNARKLKYIFLRQK